MARYYTGATTGIDTHRRRTRRGRPSRSPYSPRTQRRAARATAAPRVSTATLSRQTRVLRRQIRSTEAALARLRSRHSSLLDVPGASPLGLYKMDSPKARIARLETRLSGLKRDLGKVSSHKEKRHQRASDDIGTLEALEIASLGIPGVGLAGRGAITGVKALAGALRASRTVTTAGRTAEAARAVRGAQRAGRVRGTKTLRQRPPRAARTKQVRAQHAAAAREARIGRSAAQAGRSQRIAARLQARAATRRGPIRRARGKPAKGKSSRVVGAAGGTSAAGIAAANPLVLGAGGSNETVQRLSTTPVQLGRAAAQDPKQFGAASVRSLRDAFVGIPAAVKQFATDPEGAVDQIIADYKHRYGPLVEGDTAEFRKRALQTGLTPFAFDALIAAPPAGRVAGSVARSAGVKFATRERPKLRTAATETRDQPVSKNLGAVAVQRALDRARARKTKKRQRRGDALAKEVREGEVLPLRLRKRLRRDFALHKGRARHAMLDVQHEEVHRGVLREASRELSKAENLGIKEAVALGIRTPEQARRELPERIAAIESGRVPEEDVRAVAEQLARAEARGTPDAGDVTEAQIREWLPQAREQVAFDAPKRMDEIPRLQELIERADEVFTPKLARFADEQVVRGRRLAAIDPGVADEQATVRAVAQQLEHLARQNPSVARAMDRYDDAVDNLRATRAAVKAGEAKAGDLKEAVNEVQAAYTGLRDFADRARSGLAEGGYFPSQLRRERGDYSVHAVGGTRAIATAKRYTGKLFRLGIEDHRVQALAQGFARNIKRAFNWNLVADTFERHAIGWSRNRSLSDLIIEAERRGIDLNTVDFWNPERFRRSRENADILDDEIERTGAPEEIGSEPMAAALKQSLVRAQDIESDPAAFRKTSGWSLVPRHLAEEVHASAKQTALGRIADIATQKQSRYILGSLNLPWLQFQVVSNAFLTGIAGTGPIDLVKAQMWWRTLPKEVKLAVEPYVGLGHFQADVRQTKLGAAANNDLVNAYRGLKETAGGKVIWGGRRTKNIPGAGRVQLTARDLNPLDAMFRVDNAQNNFFRRGILYSQLKRDAYKRMGENAGAAADLQNRLAGFLTVGPKDQMRLLLSDVSALEKHAKHVSDFLGDYTTFTAAERTFFKRYVMFYSFLRFSTRLAFYTMPVRHPVMSGLLGNMARLEADEVRELLGGDQLPYALGRIYFDGGQMKVDLSRANPLLNALSQAAGSDALKGKLYSVSGLFPPIYGMVFSQIAQREPFTGKPLKVRGETQPRSYLGLPATERLRIFANQGLGTLYPYRVWEEIAYQGQPQGSDTLAWDARPTEYKDEEIKRSIGKTSREIGGTPTSTRILREVFPFLPQPSQDIEIAKSLRQQIAAEKRSLGITRGGSSSGGGGWGGSSGGGGW